jgi:hypothetical protein
MPIHSISLDRNPHSRALLFVNAVDICDICYIVFKDISAHIRNWIPEENERYRILNINYRSVMLDYFVSLRKSILANEKKSVHEYPHVDILEFSGFDCLENLPICNENLTSLFKWTNLSEEILINTNPITLLQMMSIVIDTGLHCLTIKPLSAQIIDTVGHSISLFIQIKQEIQTIISKIKIEIPVQNIVVLQLRVLTK